MAINIAMVMDKIVTEYPQTHPGMSVKRNNNTEANEEMSQTL